jgi:hypothetical protein
MRPPWSAGDWTVTAPHLEVAGARQRVSARLGRHRLWFESSDAPLVPAMESFVAPLLLPALARRRGIRPALPLDPLWVEGTRKLPRHFARWWGHGEEYPVRGVPAPAPAPAPAGATGCFFTLGVDSFHLLLTRGDELEALVYVHGFDTPLRDRPRMAAIREAMDAVAARTGKRVIVVSTNLREHPLLRRHSWGQMHGAALAAVACLLAPTVGRMIVPSSASQDLLGSWGTHPDTDPLWSTGRVRIEHDRLARRRHKILRLSAEPLAQRHLRVCWENRSPSGNCSRCEKCVRTMAALAACGALQRFPVFDRETPLPALIDRIDAVPPHLEVAWRDNLELQPPAELADAMERLIARTRAAASPPRKGVGAGRLRRFFSRRPSDHSGGVS